MQAARDWAVAREGGIAAYVRNDCISIIVASALGSGGLDTPILSLSARGAIDAAPGAYECGGSWHADSDECGGSSIDR